MKLIALPVPPFRLVSIIAIAVVMLIVSLSPSRTALAEGAPSPGSKPVAVQGEIDLSQWNFDRDGIASLDGQWEFYWQQLLTPSDFAEQDKFNNDAGKSADAPAYYPVPQVWKADDRLGSQSPGKYGYATYRLHVRLKEPLVKSNLALYIPGAATAYNLWINGELAAQIGTVGTSPSSMVPKFVPTATTFRPQTTELTLVIQMSNFVQRKGGLWDEVHLGTQKDVERRLFGKLTRELLIAGILGAMGIYHLFLYFMRRKELSTLWFGGICLMMVARGIVTGQVVLISMIPGFPWEIAVKMEYLSIIGALQFLVLFVRSQFPNEMKRGFVRVSLILLMPFALFVLATPARIYTEALFVLNVLIVGFFIYSIAVFTIATLKKRQGSLTNFIGLMIFFGASVNEILYYAHIVYTGSWLTFGLVGFLFTQSINLASVYSKSFQRVERLSEELADSNASLEVKVVERTRHLEEAKRELETANGELSRMEESRRRLMSDISHEMGTPLTTIRGYIKAMIDGLVEKGDPKYLQLIFEKSGLMDRMIGDLYELSKLEARQIEFKFRLMPVEMLVRSMFDKFQLEMRQKSINYELMPIQAPADLQTAHVLVDSNRIEQVYGNLIVNALKFTPEGGRVRVECEWSEDRPAYVKIKVADTGSGIDEVEFPTLFNRFYKGKSSHQAKAKGLGLGLAIAKEIVAAHNGDIGVRSKLGGGSTFYFTLPVMNDREKQDEEERLSHEAGA